jgi:hypothetical protein
MPIRRGEASAAACSPVPQVDLEDEAMWRALFLAIGIFMLILGAQFLFVDKLILRVREPPVAVGGWFSTEMKPGPNKTIVPQPWWPWSLISTGAVTCLYSFTLPKRLAGN